MYCEHRIRGLSQDAFCHRPYHQPVNPWPTVRSQDDQIHFLRFGKREYRVCGHSLPHDPFRLNSIVCVALHELSELLLTVMEKEPNELLIIVCRGKGCLRISP